MPGCKKTRLRLFSFQIENSIVNLHVNQLCLKQASEIAVHNEQLTKSNTTLMEQQKHIIALTQMIGALCSSTSWRFTRPLRFLSALIWGDK